MIWVLRQPLITNETCSADVSGEQISYKLDGEGYTTISDPELAHLLQESGFQLISVDGVRNADLPPVIVPPTPEQEAVTLKRELVHAAGSVRAATAAAEQASGALSKTKDQLVAANQKVEDLTVDAERANRRADLSASEAEANADALVEAEDKYIKLDSKYKDLLASVKMSASAATDTKIKDNARIEETKAKRKRVPRKSASK